MSRKNKICVIVIIILSLLSIILISQNNKIIKLTDDKIQIQSVYDYEDNVSVNNVLYLAGKKQNANGIPKAVISTFNNTNNNLLWEYYNETCQYSQLKKITYLNGILYAVGSEYNQKYGTEKLMILSINASTGNLNWKYYNNSFKFSRLNTLALSQDTIYCAGYESNKALIISLSLNGTLKGKYLINDSNISEIKSIEFKNDSLYYVAKSWDNKNTSLVSPINQINF